MFRFLVGAVSLNRRNEVQLIVFYCRPPVADRLRKLREGNRDRSCRGMPDSIGRDAMLQGERCEDGDVVRVRLHWRSKFARNVQEDFSKATVRKSAGRRAVSMALKLKRE